MNHPSWTKAIIVEALGDREYDYKMTNERFIKRHLDQIESFAERDIEALKELFAVTNSNDIIGAMTNEEASNSKNASTDVDSDNQPSQT